LIDRPAVDQSLGSIEPREGLERDISIYLAKVGFVDRVMVDIHEIPGKTKNFLLWALFCVLNILLLIVFGTNPSVILQFLRGDLGEFFFLFLGISLLGGVVGLVAVSDLSWLEDHFPGRTPPEDE
jgi:hypothetical protein